MNQEVITSSSRYPIVKVRSTEKIRTSIVERARGRVEKEEKGSVTIWERNEAHPGGEIYIVAEGPACLAARTPKVNDLITAGRLEICE